MQKPAAGSLAATTSSGQTAQALQDAWTPADGIRSLFASDDPLQPPASATPMAGGQVHALSALALQNQPLAALLCRQPHSASKRLGASAPPLAPRHVQRVEEYLLAHPREEYSPQSLAALAGVSVRSLFLGFQRTRGIGPMKFLRELRLHKVRDELLLAAAGASVTDVALAWGFFHLGRFAQEYK
ncbi:MAG: helix-turn-helix domain-containing protein, partial [Caldimonas sp.]